MITNKELEAVKLSPTKKDFYQMWNELMDLASKISYRWSPADTNESDPGIVLLKAVVALAEMLAYNTDKSILEAFMPSAAQIESMRALTSMLGYSMKFYRSATTTAVIGVSSKVDWKDYPNGIFFPKFVNLKNEDEDINYVTYESFTLSESNPQQEVKVIEGEIYEASTGSDGIISLAQLDDNNRYILPEYNIAENGIFITNVSDGAESDLWDEVDNLNTQLLNKKKFKFGFDSMQNLPYVQFPSDISNLIEDGLKIRYIRTNGATGNIAAKVLSKLEVPALWETVADDSDTGNDNIKDLTKEHFTVTNSSASTNGADPETLNSAYNNFKKTIGTFDTLVTCRDYMNKIYQMTVSDVDSTPLVSNIIVSDIRDDINCSNTICTFSDEGICTETLINKAGGKNLIEYSDLLLYPFNTVRGANNYQEYVNSFKYNAGSITDITSKLEENKTIAHKISSISEHLDGTTVSPIYCIKNKLKLNAKVYTTKKVNSSEEAEVLANIRTAIYKNFNMRQVDFGEEIPYDTIYNVIKNADVRIKDIILDEPELTTYAYDNKKDHNITNPADNSDKIISNQLACRNVISGRIEPFEYDERFASNYYDKQYSDTHGIYPADDSKSITKVEAKFSFNTSTDLGNEGLTLGPNEVIQFKAPNLFSAITYPAYVNYYLKVKDTTGKAAVPATFMTLADFRTLLSNTGGHTALVDKIDAFCADGGYTEAAFKDLVDDITDLTIIPADVPTATGSAKYSGIYRRLSKNSARVLGYLVDSDKYRYTVTSFISTITYRSAGTSYFIQKGWTNDTTEYTKTGLGQDSSFAGVAKDCEYALKTGEYLYINYTNSSTDSAGNTVKTPVNMLYKKGDIIKPNFNLYDSSIYKGSHSYSKKDGFSFTDYNVDDPEGMFTLGTNEQICIENVVNVSLTGPCNLYWELQSDNSEAESNDFVFDEPYTIKTDSGTTIKYCAYTLKAQEYLCYTDDKKLDMAYYGEGTTIVTNKIYNSSKKYAPFSKSISDSSTISQEDILSMGLAAAIPWQYYNLTDNAENILTIVENKFINLTEGDTLLSVATTNSTINRDWTVVNNSSASYKLAGSDIIYNLPKLDIDGLDWQIRSKLDINMGPETPQTLGPKDKITVSFNSGDPVNISGAYVEGTTINALSVYSNYLYQSSIDTIDIKAVEASIGKSMNFSLKCCQVDFPSNNNKAINLYNYSTYYTKLAMKDLNIGSDLDTGVKLNTYIPEKEWGLIMFYYIKPSTQPSTHITIKAYKKNTSGTYEEVAGIRVFNKDSSWAKSKTLDYGMSNIEVSSDVEYIKIFSDSNKSDVIIFSDLRVIKGINSKLRYYNLSSEDGTSSYTQLLADIKLLDTNNKFFYGMHIPNNEQIDLNPLLTADEENLSSQLIWYDKNNINNKFVISEINADYLATGITIAKSSKI